MTWLTWRQHRWEAGIGGLFLGLVAAALVRSKLQLQALLDQIRVDSCSSGLGTAVQPGVITFGAGQARPSAACQALSQQIGQHIATSNYLFLAVLVVPVLVGMFVGAPLLAREFEHGTHRLVWTQSVTRLHWLRAKLGWLLGAVLVAGGLLAVLGVLYRAAVDADKNPFSGFDVQGPVVVAYGLFALALAAAAGALIRRTLPAMLVALVGFTAARILVAAGLRPRFLPPLVEDATGGSGFARNWYLQFSGYVDAQGHALGLSQVNDVIRACIGSPPSPSSKAGLAQCMRDHGLFLHNVYQPADRFWVFQSIEAIIFLILALGLIAFTLWWVKRRPA